jgi:transposase-like protein
MRAPAKMSYTARMERGAEIKRRVEAGEKVVAVAHEYGIHETSIYYWVRGLNSSHEKRRLNPRATVQTAVRTQPNSGFALGAM